MDGGLLCTYVISLLFKTGFEIGFLFLFYKLYDGFNVPRLVKCDMSPCPNTVDCYISKPTEKKVFLYIVVVTSCLCIVLNVIEFSYLILKYSIKCCLRKHAKQVKDSSEPKTPNHVDHNGTTLYHTNDSATIIFQGEDEQDLSPSHKE